MSDIIYNTLIILGVITVVVVVLLFTSRSKEERRPSARNKAAEAEMRGQDGDD